MGREIIHCAVFPKDGDTSFYTMVYQDGASGKAFAKKFQIGGVTRDKLYPLVKSEGSQVVYFEVSPTEKAMPKKLHVSLDGRSGARVREFDFDLARGAPEQPHGQGPHGHQVAGQGSEADRPGLGVPGVAGR